MRLRTCLSVLALLALVPPSGARAEDEPAPTVKTDADHDFEWTIPAGWTALEPSAEDRAQGYHAKAKRVVDQGKEAWANVFVKDAGGASVDTFVAVMKDNKIKVLSEPEIVEDTLAWAGATDAKSVRIDGKAENGSAVAWFVRAAVVGGRYHQVSVMSSNGAHADLEGEVDAVLDGYRVLSAGGDGGAGEAAGGAAFEVTHADLGITWKLPKFWGPPPKAEEGGEPPVPGRRTLPPVKEGDPERVWTWGFAQVADPDSPNQRILGVAILQFNGETAIQLELSMRKSRGDIDPVGIVRNDNNFKPMEDAFDGVPIPTVDEDAKLGNARGASHTFSGKSRQTGKGLWIRDVFLALSQKGYQLHAVAHEGAEQKDREWLKMALDGLTFADTSTGVRGPYLTPFASASADRSDWIAKGEKKVARGAITYTKPAQFGELKRTPSMEGWVFAAEARKPGAYLFVSLQRFDKDYFGSGTPPRTYASLIDEWEGSWRNEMKDPVTRDKAGKATSKKDSFKGASGNSYVFSGTVAGNPIVERGWIVGKGSTHWWVRAQYIGKDAEKTMSGDWKDFSGSIRWE